MKGGGPSGKGAVDMTRRSFLGYLAGAAITFIGVTLGFLGLGAFFSPALKAAKRGEWVSLGRAEAFPPGQPKKVDFTLSVKDGWMETRSAKSVWVVRRQDEGFTVFNSRCTHLGCIVDWKTEKKEPFSAHHWKGPAFYSPCHAGVFTVEGRVIAGPPPRPLDTLEQKVQDGELSCRYLDFRVGIPEKVPI